MSSNARIVIVGAGPAGMRAAEQLAAAGLRPIVIDEAQRFGGQIYRQPPAVMQRERSDLYGFEAGRASAVLDRFDALRPQIDYRSDTLVWQIEPGCLQTVRAGRVEAVPFDALILATGATDRVLPFPGWTLPGVYTLGAAQVALKHQGCLIGPRVIFAGTGALLYLVAWQYASHGGQVAAVLDTAPFSAKLRALPAMLARPAVAAKGTYFLTRLRLMGVPVHSGVTLLRAEGDTGGGSADNSDSHNSVDNVRVRSLVWQRGGKTHSTPCDAIGFGHGLRSETQLADLAGCAFAYSEIEQAWLPTRDAAGRTSVHGVYVAGDGAGILGADAAELSGARAALAAIEDLSLPAPAGRAAQIEQAMQPHIGFRRGLETAFPPPADWAAQAPDELIICRCEEVTAGELRACARDTGARELNRLKALTRIGMGRCQGRMCAPGAARLLAHAHGCALQDVGRLRGQAPVKPLPISLLHEHAPSTLVPEDQDD